MLEKECRFDWRVLLKGMIDCCESGIKNWSEMWIHPTRIEAKHVEHSPIELQRPKHDQLISLALLNIFGKTLIFCVR